MSCGCKNAYPPGVRHHGLLSTIDVADLNKWHRIHLDVVPILQFVDVQLADIPLLSLFALELANLTLSNRAYTCRAIRIPGTPALTWGWGELRIENLCTRKV